MRFARDPLTALPLELRIDAVLRDLPEELEMGRVYVSPRGNPVRRLNKTHALLAEAAAHFNGGAAARPHRGAPDERPRHTRFEEDGDAAGEPPRKRKKKAIEGRRFQPKPRGGAR